MSAMTHGESAAENKGFHIALWAVQIVLAFAFVSAGVMKTFLPLEQLVASMAWVESVGSFVRFIGICELLGGIGMIVPAATRIKPVLTPIAAIGLLIIMVLAAGLHFTRTEFDAIPITLVLGALAAFVAWGRFTKARIHPR
mgnify:CR=1 FL=1